MREQDAEILPGSFPTHTPRQHAATWSAQALFFFATLMTTATADWTESVVSPITTHQNHGPGQLNFLPKECGADV